MQLTLLTNIFYFYASYYIFIAMSFIKDSICMNILHQIMHRHWYQKHYVHHLPMKVRVLYVLIFFESAVKESVHLITLTKNSKNSPQETSNVTFTFFDCEDLVLENLIAPALLFLLMFFMDPTKPPTIDMFAYVMLHVLDANSHSLCPYTVGFYFPPLDSMLSPTVSHNLHHALNMGHYTVWPLHQLKGIFMYDNRDKVHFDGSLAQDWATYNRVFNTNFPEGRGVKVE